MAGGVAEPFVDCRCIVGVATRSSGDALAVAGALVVDHSGRVLMIHRDSPGMSWWEVPGGKVEANEEPWDAAVRELGEELAIAVELVAEIATDTFDSLGTQVRYTWFLAKLVGGTPRPVEQDFDAVGYFDVSDLASMADLSPSAHRVVHRYQGSLSASIPTAVSAIGA